jgi:4-amino-4-deoxy-L-arabinose transferase-like glycosyltransferase
MSRSRWSLSEWRIGPRQLAWIAGVAVVIKTLLLFVALPAAQDLSPGNYEAGKFPDWYDLLAINIANGNGYRFFPETTETMLRTPAWPLVLAGIFKLFGPSIFAVKVLNMLLSIGTGWLTFLLGRKISGSELLGAMAALIAFFHPAILIADSRGGVESFYMFFMAAFMVLVYRAFDDDSLKKYLESGLVLGVLLLIKSTAVMFAPCVFLYKFLKQPDLAGAKKATLVTGVLTVAATVVLAPWIVRNYMLSGEFVPTMSVGGMSSYSGYYIANNRHTGRDQYVLDLEASEEMGRVAEQMGIAHRPGYYTQFYTIADEVKFYGRLGEIVRQKYSEEPGAFRTALLDNATGFWIRGRSAKATQLNMVLVLPFLALTIAGIFVGRKYARPVLPLALMVGAYYAVHIPILGQARYHVPLIPVMAVLLVLVLLPWTRPGGHRHAG